LKRSHIILTSCSCGQLITAFAFVSSQVITHRRTRKIEEIEVLNLSDIVRKGSVFAIYHKKSKK